MGTAGLAAPVPGTTSASGFGAPVAAKAAPAVPVLGKPPAQASAVKDDALDLDLTAASRPAPPPPAAAVRSPRADDPLAIDFGEAGAPGAREPEVAPTFAPEPKVALDRSKLPEPRGASPSPNHPSGSAARLTPIPPTKAAPSPPRSTPPAPARPPDASAPALDPVMAVFSAGTDSTQPPVDPGAARPHRQSLEARAGKSRGGGGWADAATDVIQVKGARPPAAAVEAEAARRHGAGAQGNVFPREAVLRAKDELLAWVKHAPPKTRYQVIAAVATPPLLWIVFFAWAFWPGHPTYYVTESQPLLVGPAAGEVYPALSPVDRGGRVELVDEVGDYSLIRDSLGRVGYVRSRDLKGSAPQALPSQPFADCVRAPIPGATEICQRRAQQQFEDCRKVCRRADDASCADHCQKRFSDCLGTCEQLEAETPPVAATPRAEPPKPAVKREEPSVPDPAPEATHPKAKKLVKAKKKTK